MKQFEVGKSYEANNPGFGSVKILKRTVKFVTVTNGPVTWRMKIRVDEHGDEYVVDSSVPKQYRDDFVFSAGWVVE